MPHPTCYTCGTACTRLIEVDDGFYAYLCPGPCERIFWETLIDLVGVESIEEP